MKNKRRKSPAYKGVRPFLIGVLFVLFSSMILACSTDTDNIAETSTEIAVETEQIATEETESEIATENEISTEIEENYVENTVDATEQSKETKIEPSTEIALSAAEIPAYTGSPYIAVNNNVPQFLDTDLSTSSYEYYSELDGLGRCGVVYACIGRDLMPTEERGEIGSVRPTGWHTVKYDVVDGRYLYNRCHLIGYQLSGENANTKNLITGTRYLNVEGMLPFENMVADYVKETGNHVMYRVTPIFEGNNLLASGVQMEAKSVEDHGQGILFNIYCYNVQPQVTIDYATGESSCDAGSVEVAEPNVTNDAANTTNTPVAEEASDVSGPGSSDMVWISETGSKYHSINNCGRMNPDKARQMTEEEAINAGYGKCSKCW